MSLTSRLGVDAPGALQGRRASNWWPNLLMAAYGAGWCFTLPLVGQLYAAELVAVVCLPFVGWRQTLAQYRSLRIVLAAYGVMLVALMLSDYVNNTEPQAFLRGWANIVFAATSLIFAVSILRKNLNSILYFLFATFLFKLILGDAASAMRNGYIELSFEVIQQNANMFKVRFVPFLIPAIMLAGFHLYRFSIVIYTIVAVAFFALDARSMALCILISAMILLFKRAGVGFSPRILLPLAIPVLIAAQLAYVGYVNYSLEYNPNGQSGRQLQHTEDPYNPLSLLFQGRSEWTVAPTVIADKPIFGHGSWAYDYDGKYAALRAENTGQEETLLLNSSESIPLIPTHSVLLGSWVWAGIGGFIGFLIFFSVFVRDMRTMLLMNGPYFAIVALGTILVGWDIFFSPLQVLRLNFPHYMGLLIVVAQGIRKSRTYIANRS